MSKNVSWKKYQSMRLPSSAEHQTLLVRTSLLVSLCRGCGAPESADAALCSQEAKAKLPAAPPATAAAVPQQRKPKTGAKVPAAVAKGNAAEDDADDSDGPSDSHSEARLSKRDCPHL